MTIPCNSSNSIMSDSYTTSGQKTEEEIHITGILDLVSSTYKINLVIRISTISFFFVNLKLI